MGSLVPSKEDVRPDTLSMKDKKSAAEFYRECMARNLTALSAPFAGGERGRAKQVIEFFDALATPTERGLLRPSGKLQGATDGDRRRISLLLHR